MAKADKKKKSGMVRFMAEGRNVNEAGGSCRITIPRQLADEWDLTGDDVLLFTAEEGSNKATIYKPGSEGEFSLEYTDEE